MTNYAAMTDSQLVVIIQNGDDTYGTAFSELYGRYEARIKQLARETQRRQHRISYEDWVCHHNEHFWEAVRKFDVDNKSKVPFGRYMEWKLRKRAFDVVRKNFYVHHSTDEAERYAERVDIQADSLDASISEADGEMMRHDVVADPKAVVRPKRVQSTELYKFIRKQSSDMAKFVKMRTAGLSSVEIAKQLGHTGSVSAMKEWARRMTIQLRRVAVDFYKTSGALEEIKSLVNPEVIECASTGKIIPTAALKG